MAFTDKQRLLLLSNLMLTLQGLSLEGRDSFARSVLGSCDWFDIGDDLARLDKIANLDCKGLQLAAGSGGLNQGFGFIKMSAQENAIG